MKKGFIVAATHSGSGKTTITLGILRALKNRGLLIGSAKAGPDFIDTVFHQQSSGYDCFNLDPWAMREELIFTLARQQLKQGLLIVEAMMGLFDGADNGKGSSADLAQLLGLPIVLVIDCTKQSHSVAATVCGFRDFKSGLFLAGVILNNLGSEHHSQIMHRAMSSIGITVFGSVMRNPTLRMSSRYLGLVQSEEYVDIESFLENAATIIEHSIHLDALLNLEISYCYPDGNAQSFISPGKKLVIARDRAFSFFYPHILNALRKRNAQFSFFSPLANESPALDADAVILPGGYPELYAEQLASNHVFLQGLWDAVKRGAFVYGECGGYMVLGTFLIDSKGQYHKMANLLPLITSFEKKKLSLGYRVVKPLKQIPFLTDSNTHYTAHEFHYSTILEEGTTERLFDVADSRNRSLGKCGLRKGNVMGSYMHLIDQI
ncbi:cobyrinate a,c-diamide synthase [Candidatus Endowatersipora endosymbiont of Watersipora subatra]|uniref:cobyrinate a,c-diamide synthase n=1 Tax=Candidatus Endowatersipora endosymbiont of Watersipora subatra TaxID=3077946 RepID=UPI00312CB39E